MCGRHSDFKRKKEQLDKSLVICELCRERLSSLEHEANTHLKRCFA